MWVMLKQSFAGPFRRSIRGPAAGGGSGPILRTYEFAPGVVVGIPPEDVAVIRADVGRALVEMVPERIDPDAPPARFVAADTGADNGQPSAPPAVAAAPVIVAAEPEEQDAAAPEETPADTAPSEEDPGGKPARGRRR